MLKINKNRIFLIKIVFHNQQSVENLALTLLYNCDETLNYSSLHFFVFKPISSQDLNTNLDFDLVRSLELVLKNHKLIEASKIDSKAAEFRVKQSKGIILSKFRCYCKLWT